MLLAGCPGAGPGSAQGGASLDSDLVGTWTDDLHNRLELKPDHSCIIALVNMGPDQGHWKTNGDRLIYGTNSTTYYPEIVLQIAPDHRTLTRTDGISGTWVKQ
jgi:hypothetical protein